MIEYVQIFYTNIRKLLKLKRMTLKELSDSSGISTAYLTLITTGRANPSLDKMSKIANGLDVPLAYLLTNNDLPPNELPFNNRLLPNDKGLVFVNINTLVPTSVAWRINKILVDANCVPILQVSEKN